MHNFGGCAMKVNASKFHLRVLSDTKESLTMLFHFSSPKWFTVNGLLELDFS